MSKYQNTKYAIYLRVATAKSYCAVCCLFACSCLQYDLASHVDLTLCDCLFVTFGTVAAVNPLCYLSTFGVMAWPCLGMRAVTVTVALSGTP